MENALAEDVSPHHVIHDLFIAVRRKSVQKLIIWGLGSQGQSRECVHNQVHPEHLHRGKRGIREDYCSREDDKHCNNVDSQLELQEFANVVINVASILDSDKD